MAPRCNMLWIGESLGAVERACILSVLRQGHPLTLWCYSVPAGVPPGTELRDAAEVLPAESILRHHTGSVALFSDWFRYSLQRSGHGIWLDSDVYLLKPVPDAEIVLSEYEPGRINGGVLKLPTDSPLLASLLALFEAPAIPPWLRPRARTAAWWRYLTTGRVDLTRMPWGTAGPDAITALAGRLGLDRLAAPAAIFSPVPWQHADWITDPAIPLDAKIGEETIAIHLWNERIKAHKKKPAPAGSFLARLQAEATACA